MKIKEKIINLKNNFLLRTFMGTLFSLISTLLFASYNAYLGIKYVDAFAIGISIYYFLIVLIKAVALLVEKSISKKSEDVKTKSRLKNYTMSSIFIFIIDLCLIAPIILMVIQPKDVQFGIIPAIAMATFTVYKITMAIISYRRSKKTKNHTIILLKEINIIETVVSILSLQHTLIMVNGGMDASMRTLSFASSIGFIILIVAFSVFSFIRNRNMIKQNHE